MANDAVAILRADVKDLVFPGNLQEIMNKVLAAERLSQAQLVEARTRAQTQQIEAEASAATRKMEAETLANAARLQAQVDAEARKLRADAELHSLKDSAEAAAALASSPALLRLRELDALKELGRSANARIYIGFDKHAPTDRE